MTPRPLIFDRFLEPKSIQDRKKRHSKSLQKSSRILIRFLIDFGLILDPTGRPKIQHSSSFFVLGATLGPSWRQEGAQSAPRRLQSSIFQEICIILRSIFDGFRKISKLIFYTIPCWISNSMFYFWWHFNRAASICNSVFPAAGSARWRLGARSALDNICI